MDSIASEENTFALRSTEFLCEYVSSLECGLLIGIAGLKGSSEEWQICSELANLDGTPASSNPGSFGTVDLLSGAT